MRVDLFKEKIKGHGNFLYEVKDIKDLEDEGEEIYMGLYAGNSQRDIYNLILKELKESYNNNEENIRKLFPREWFKISKVGKVLESKYPGITKYLYNIK